MQKAMTAWAKSFIEIQKTAYMVRHEKTYTEYTIRDYTQPTEVGMLSAARSATTFAVYSDAVYDCKVSPKRSY